MAHKPLKAAFGGIIGAFGGMTAVISFALWWLWPTATPPYLLGIAGVVVFVGSLVVQNFKMAREFEPRFEVACGTERSDKRNQPRGPAHDPYLMDFLGIEFWNSAPKPIQGVQARLIKITKPLGEAWHGSINLNFAPHDNMTEKPPIHVGERFQPVNVIPELRQDAPEMACLCSIMRKGTIMFGTLDANWRPDPQTFAQHLKEPGEYVFTIVFTGNGSASETIQVGLDWHFDREAAKLRLL